MIAKLLHGILFLLLSASSTSGAPRERVEALIKKMKAAKPPSRSSGTLRDGKLELGAELAKAEGVGYVVFHPERDTNFGADRMVYGLMRLGVEMIERLGAQPHHRLLINEMSSASGGMQKRHINHQMGLDVDLGLYSTNRQGRADRARWVKFDKDGKSTKGTVLFDAARNWELVTAILESETFGEIRALLLADWLKGKLLAHARERLAKTRNPKAAVTLKKLIERSEKLIRQPTSSPHDDHIHLSLAQ